MTAIKGSYSRETMTESAYTLETGMARHQSVFVSMIEYTRLYIPGGGGGQLFNLALLYSHECLSEKEGLIICLCNLASVKLVYSVVV